MSRSREEGWADAVDARDLAKAIELAKRYCGALEQLNGKRIRILRAIVYEGDAMSVMRQLAKSLPTGTKEIRPQNGGPLTITVIDEGLLQIIE